MKRYAVLDSSSIVKDLILAPSLEVAESVTFSDCVKVNAETVVDVGYLYSDGSFSAPVVETPAEETPTEETPA